MVHFFKHSSLPIITKNEDYPWCFRFYKNHWNSHAELKYSLLSVQNILNQNLEGLGSFIFYSYSLLHP